MLQIRHLKKHYNVDSDNMIRLFEDFNIDFSKEMTAILGPNGCGKSTLLDLISGAKTSDAGTIHLEGENITAMEERFRSKDIARVHQNPSMGVAPSLTVLENLALADHKGKTVTLKKLVRKDRIDFYRAQLAELNLGMEDKLSSLVGELSGGQRQSLALVMTTMKEPKILLLDEHTAALDPGTSELVMEKTRELVDRHQMMTIMVTHDPRMALRFADRIVVLSRGNVQTDVLAGEIEERELLEAFVTA
jgi:putative ABC transport system ATP-binding protein